jgi:uncharacterized protein YdaU (DUF1376 family)
MGWALMAEFPALPLWTDAYLGDTAHLTTIEHGAYLLLLMTAWRSKDTKLPDDDRLLARYTRCTLGQWKRLRPILAAFFTIENGFWQQGRLTDEAVAVRQKRDAAAANGRASALKRKGRHSAKREQSVSGASTDGQRESNLTSNHIHVPLSNDNGADSDKVFWEAAKSYLSGENKNPGALIGKWVRDHGKGEVAAAITRAQVERPVEKIPFIQGCLRQSKKTADDWSVLA